MAVRWFQTDLFASGGDLAWDLPRVGAILEKDVFATPSGGSGSVGLAVSTEQALALAGRQVLPVGLATATESALARVARVQQQAGTATTTEQALALAGRQVLPVGLATATESALGRDSASLRPVGLAQETGVAIARSGVALRATGTATTTEQALALAGRQVLPVGLAGSTEQALALAGRQVLPVGLATTTESAFALVGVLVLPLGKNVDAEYYATPTPGVFKASALYTDFYVDAPQSSFHARETVADTFCALGGRTAFNPQELLGAHMQGALSPGSFHVFSINWKYGDRPYLHPDETLVSAVAKVNGVTVTSGIEEDTVKWNVSVADDAAMGSRVESVVSVVTNSVPPRKETRKVLHYVGTEAAQPIQE